MTVTINGTTGITTPAVTNEGAYTGDGVVFADGTPSNTLVTTTGGNVGIGTSSPYAVGGSWKMLNVGVGGIQGGGTSSQSSLLVQNCYYNGSSWQRATTGATGYIDVGGGTISFSNDSSGSAGTFTPTERMRIDSSGNLLVGTTSNALSGSWPVSGGIVMNRDYSGFGAVAINSSSTTGNQYYIGFGRGGSQCGSILSGGTNSTSYSTSSDYRLKENIAPMTDALATVSALKPVTYTWKADGSAGQGFIAHELQAVVPDCVTGEKDAVDADGNPVYQGIDTSFLVATLTAAIQELKAKVDSLQAELATLKGQA